MFDDEKKLARIANEIRQDVVMMTVEAGSGHLAGSLGMADVLATLYFNLLKIDPENPWKKNRDKLILSCGHLAPALYAVLARRGFFPLSELNTLRQINSRLQGHPEYKSLPGIEAPSGPLGQGLSIGIGIALAEKFDNFKNRVYVISSDGEQQEGQIWEGVMFAGFHKLSNLTLFIDRNHIQIDGTTEEILDLEPLAEKYESFGWHVISIDGHCFEHIIDSVKEAKTVRDRPSVIICNTTPGKGVSFMQNNHNWHGRAITSEEALSALRQLKSLDGSNEKN